MNKRHKKAMAILLAAALTLGMFPLNAATGDMHTEDAAKLEAAQTMATPTDLAVMSLGIQPASESYQAGPFTITGGVEETDWSFNNGVLTVYDGANVTISGDARSNERIVVPSGANAEITLNGVTIEAAIGYSALDIVGAALSLVLEGVNNLTGGYMNPGIHVPDSSALIISGEGTLVARGGNYGGAAIGGGSGGSGGNITINGGTVNATGGHGGAAIGGGSGGHGGNITINGGTVNATGSDNGAGIGGGNRGNGGTVIINGGRVEAIGGYAAAGIGGGHDQSGTTVIINDGIVNATGGDYGAGIGGGYRGHGGNITISGGTVEATGGSSAAGIGGGSRNGGGNITISGGTVEATGGSSAAGIGGGSRNGGGNITISGGTVTATGFEGAGIGGGSDGHGGNVTISGDAVVYANSESYYYDMTIFGMAIGHGLAVFVTLNPGTLRIIGNPTIIANAPLAPPPITPNITVLQTFIAEPVERPEPTPRPAPTPAPDFTVTANSIKVNNPTDPGAVNNAINAFLADADEETGQIVLELPGNHNTKTIDRDGKQALIDADMELVIVSDDVSVTLSIEKLEELIGRTDLLNIRLASTVNNEGNTEVSVDFTRVDGRSKGGFDNPTQVTVDMSDMGVLNPNPYRVTALDRNGMIIGGTYNPRTELFTVNITGSTTFTIEMVPELLRLKLAPGSSMKKDLAGNIPHVLMSTAPVVRDDTVLIPVTYVGEALGFGVDWNPDTQEVTLSQDGRSFTFGIDDVHSHLADGSVFVTPEYAGRLFGVYVGWDEVYRAVKIKGVR